MRSSLVKSLALGLMAATAPMAAAQAAVTVLGWPGGPEETALRAVAEIYNGQERLDENNRVEVLFFARDGFWDKLQADLAAGTQAFDLNLIATYSIGRYAPFMEPVTLSAEAENVFGGSVLSTMQFEGQQYGVPTDLSLHFMYYREDLIDALLSDADAAQAYGDISEEYLGQRLEPKAPDDWTWDDYAATALYFTQSINPDSPTRYGTILQMQNLLFNMMVWQSTARSFGGDWMDAEGNVTIDSEAYRRGLELYKMLYDAGATPPDSTSYEFPEANAAFVSGQVAAMLQWNGAAGELTNPETAPAVAETVGIVAPPAGDEARSTHIHGLGFGLNSNAPNKEGALAFLEWLSTEEAALAYAAAGGAPALTPEVVSAIAEDRPDLVQLGEFASQYGYVMTGATGANALSVYELQAQHFTGYWTGQETLDEALAAVSAGMTDLLSE